MIETLLIIGDKCDELKDHCYMRVGIPVKPMLAKPTKGVQIILQRFENIKFTCEYKYDGFRGQVHYYDDPKTEGKKKIEIYSRNLENMTEAYPDIVEFFNTEFKAEEVKNFILDCEIVPFDQKTGKILNF
jgi:DNA ligase-1